MVFLAGAKSEAGFGTRLAVLILIGLHCEKDSNSTRAEHPNCLFLIVLRFGLPHQKSLAAHAQKSSKLQQHAEHQGILV